MSRPALAASRGSQIIDFLCSAPDRRFSLTEIAHATGVNRASCLAILAELTRRGHLCRHPTRKTYWLGPALIAVGRAALIAHPMTERARAAAERLKVEVGLPMLLSTRIDADIVCIFSLTDEKGRTAGLRAGERVALLPPVGASFIAWSAPEEREAWIASGAQTEPEQAGVQLGETLALTRKRGFHVTLRRRETNDVALTLARAMSDGLKPDPGQQASGFAETLDAQAPQPDMLDSDRAYDVQLIAAPLIDPETSAISNLCIGGFVQPLTGTAIAELGRSLIASCVEIMKH